MNSIDDLNYSENDYDFNDSSDFDEDYIPDYNSCCNEYGYNYCTKCNIQLCQNHTFPSDFTYSNSKQICSRCLYKIFNDKIKYNSDTIDSYCCIFSTTTFIIFGYILYLRAFII